MLCTLIDILLNDIIILKLNLHKISYVPKECIWFKCTLTNIMGFLRLIRVKHLIYLEGYF